MRGVKFEESNNVNKVQLNANLKNNEINSQSDFEDKNISLDGWDDALTPEEFLAEAKKIIRQKFEERSKV